MNDNTLTNNSLKLPQADLDQLVALFNAGHHAELESRARLLLEQYPDSGFVWKALGAALQVQGKDALPALQKATELLPDDAAAHNNLGAALQDLGQLDGALANLRRALELKSDYAAAYNNLGAVLRSQGWPIEAEINYRRALELKPDYAEALVNLADVLSDLGQLNGAVVACHRALEINPDYAGAHYNLGHCLLAMGRLSEGWPEHEYRWEGSKPKPPRPATHLPQWTGQKPSPNDRLLVFEEQGFGDRLQFARYLPLAAQRFAGGVSILTASSLLTLFHRSFPDVEVMESISADQSAWQWQCPLLSLPLAFNTTLETIPSQVPYLIPDPIKVARWQARIVELGLPTATRKIGVVWKTGSMMKNAALRSLTLQQLAPLLNQPGCAWFSLQKEPDPDKMSWVASGKLIDWSEEFGDFDETAALAMNMDLVISVDTSVAHLAGGLGLPTWLLNRHASEWRWMRDREDSPWYPTMRIFTQKEAGDWDEVVSRMRTALSKL